LKLKIKLLLEHFITASEKDSFVLLHHILYDSSILLNLAIMKQSKIDILIKIESRMFSSAFTKAGIL